MAKYSRKRLDKALKKAKRSAEHTAALDRTEDARGRFLERRLAEAHALAPLADDKPEVAAAPLAELWPRRRAMLIINSKSGPNRDSLGRVRELVDILGTFGICADVRVKLRKSQARKLARSAATREAYELVIAAGGDGTVEAVAAGLVGTRATLGIIPLGTYNNVATCLGIPADVHEACALIAVAAVRRIDVGEVSARHMKKPRPFLEVSTVGLGAALGPLGQDVEKGRWDEAADALPRVLQMSPTPTVLSLDNNADARGSHTLLVTVSNTPRAGAALTLAPNARMDDGLLDVCMYEDMDQRAVLAQFLPNPKGQAATESSGSRVNRARVRSVEVRTVRPMPVSIESKLVGVTPARFTVRPGALSVIVGDGAALLHPASPVLVAASVSAAHLLKPVDGADADASTSTSTSTVKASGPEPSALQALVPVAGRVLDAAPAARSVAAPVLVALAGAVAGSLAPRLSNRLRRLI